MNLYIFDELQSIPIIIILKFRLSQLLPEGTYLFKVVLRPFTWPYVTSDGFLTNWRDKVCQPCVTHLCPAPGLQSVISLRSPGFLEWEIVFYERDVGA